ncbi:hypothetical protein IPA_08345 [Ignicoccus pacificus DSM 13166]|uniref:Thil AANH domain-containing protein n=1 Tax=Ignicoccus pacificus DSM 13166 TaxID=940294 RepID=A0A977PLY8_9CREN|nr:hypothetical protein IPA_08345 [Ignicoccus pacificus DSM 13166]
MSNRALLYSGGLDSFALLRALRPKSVVHFIVDPKASKLALRALAIENPEVEVYLFDHRPYLKSVRERLKRAGKFHYLCEACKRGMIEKASQFFEELIIGDSVGQVASQTLSNMSFITNGKVLLRPLAGSDKEDIEEFLSGNSANIARRVSSMTCPWKPLRVATATKRRDVIELEEIVLEELANIRYLGMKTAQELTVMG